MSISGINRAVPIAALALTLTGLTLDGQPIDDGQIAEHFRAGQQDMQQERFAEAVTQFKEALRGQPDLVEARVNLGLAYQALGDYPLAVAELSRAVRQRPNLFPASLFLGISYLKLGLPEKAIPPLHVALSIEPSNREAARALATAEMEQLNYRDAAARFRKLSSSDPDKATGWYGLGHDYLEMVKQLTTQLSSQFPDSAWSFRFAGDVLAERHLWNDAASAYRKALQTDPGQSGLHGALAEALFKGGRTAQAEAEQALEKYPDSAGSVKTPTAPGSGVGRSLAACEKGPDSHRCANFLKSVEKTRQDDLLRLGQALLAAGDDEAASEILATAFKKNKSNPESVYWLCRSYLRLSDACFSQLTALYPGSWRAHELKAEEFHIRHADGEAIEEYRAAERLNPKDDKIHEALGEILVDKKALPEARSELETALRLNPNSPRTLYLIGRVEVDAREPAKGIPYLETALHYDPTLIEARPVLGMAYLKVGKPELAVEQLQRSSELDRYGDLHYLLYEAYRQEGKGELAAKALARSQALRRKSAADDQAKIRKVDDN